MHAETHHKSISEWKSPLKKENKDPMFRAYPVPAASKQLLAQYNPCVEEVYFAGENSDLFPCLVHV